MKWRIASIAFLLSSVSTGLAWLTLQPVLMKLMDSVRQLAPEESAARVLLSRSYRLLPMLLALDLVALAVLGYVVLDFMVGRPLRRMEASVESLQRLELDQPLRTEGGPLLSRIGSALTRMTEALQAERSLTQRQLDELRDANARLARTQTELVASERLATVGKLAAGVAHEIGNPLSGILGYVSLARSRARSQPELTDYLERIEGELQRIDGIVRGLLDLGRPAEPALAPVEVRDLVEGCVRLVRAGEDFQRVELETRLEPAAARADAGALTQILLNLLLNAAQAQRGAGRVSVSLRQVEREVLLRVEDEGPGVPEALLPRIFEPFFTTKGPGEGSGLGLAICQLLATRMGGQIEAANRPEGGAVFTLRLPAA